MKTTKLLFFFLFGVLSMQAQESDVVYFEGSVSSQDGTPIAGAIVSLFKSESTGSKDCHYDGVTDINGNYSVKVDEGDWPFYMMSIKAEGYPDYLVNKSFSVKQGANNLFPVPKDIVLWNKLTFIEGQQSTIILPDAPDPSWGRYYRLDRVEDRTIVFERENEPKANVPYVFFPNSNFTIDLNGYDYANLPDPGYIPLFPDDDSQWYGFWGSYTNTDFMFESGVVILDETLDCSKGVAPNFARVGAFRAYLVASRKCLNQFGTPNCLYVGEQTGISNVTTIPAATSVFDLQGRRIQGEPKHGVYIQNGKKVMK